MLSSRSVFTEASPGIALPSHEVEASSYAFSNRIAASGINVYYTYLVDELNWRLGLFRRGGTFEVSRDEKLAVVAARISGEAPPTNQAVQNEKKVGVVPWWPVHDKLP